MAKQPDTSHTKEDSTERPADAEELERQELERKEHKLDEAIEMTFPASDPISI